jgi:alkyl hydroperoxide reductase subunit AhpC
MRLPKAYSAFSTRLGTKRAVIVIDEQGIVRHRHDHLLGLDYQSVDELRRALDAIPAAATG